MRIATWNINSAKARQGQFIEWLDRVQPDIVCLQETKLSDEAFLELFDADALRRGYSVAHHGTGRWNGVAILSRQGLADIERGLPGGPGFPDPEPRAISATCGDLKIFSLYVPNGRAVDDPHFAYKLTWLAALRLVLATAAAGTPVMALGDFNIAPTDADVWDPADFVGATHVTDAERHALQEILEAGFVDLVRHRWPEETIYTYWDYRQLCFPKNLGMRIDLALATEDLVTRTKAVWVDRAARKGPGTSDHAPLVVDLDTAPDGDIGPLVPPPSARPTRAGGAAAGGQAVLRATAPPNRPPDRRVPVQQPGTDHEKPGQEKPGETWPREIKEAATLPTRPRD